MQDKRDKQEEDAAPEPEDTQGTGGDAAPEDRPETETAPGGATPRPDTPDPEPEAGGETAAEAGETTGEETEPGALETAPEAETASDDAEPGTGEATAGEADPQAAEPAPETEAAAPEPREAAGESEPPPDTGSETTTAPPPEPDAAPPPEPDPEAGPPCSAGLFGKMPARGDFISRAIEREVLRPLEEWLLKLVQETRELLGAHWDRAWRHAPPWRFWIGPDTLRGDWTRSSRGPDRAGVVTGVLLPSADRQGRLFPLVLVLADDHARLMPPPVLAPPDRGWYAACDRLLHAAREGTALETVEADLAALRAPRLPDEAGEMAPLLVQRALWGQGAGQAAPDDADDVWSDIRASDHHLAATGRSYWWCEAPGGATSVISLAGLPDAETFAFMLTDAIPADTPQTGA